MWLDDERIASIEEQGDLWCISNSSLLWKLKNDRGRNEKVTRYSSSQISLVENERVGTIEID